jgi:hypothetical protein
MEEELSILNTLQSLKSDEKKRYWILPNKIRKIENTDLFHVLFSLILLFTSISLT